MPCRQYMSTQGIIYCKMKNKVQLKEVKVNGYFGDKEKIQEKEMDIYCTSTQQ